MLDEENDRTASESLLAQNEDAPLMMHLSGTDVPSQQHQQPRYSLENFFPRIYDRFGHIVCHYACMQWGLDQVDKQILLFFPPLGLIL